MSDAQEFVGNAHGDLDAVRAALEADSTFANATWDWGGGDWETALGAAAHMGRRDIAELLLGYGARLDVFAAAMLGDVEIVRAILSAHPEMREAKGPHGIPLREHAVAGGEQAQPVLELLDAS
jgi:ankyrin repeat protein